MFLVLKAPPAVEEEVVRFVVQTLDTTSKSHSKKLPMGRKPLFKFHDKSNVIAAMGQEPPPVLSQKLALNARGMARLGTSRDFLLLLALAVIAVVPVQLLLHRAKIAVGLVERKKNER